MSSLFIPTIPPVPADFDIPAALAKLAEPFPPEMVRWRIGHGKSEKKKMVGVLAYVDARAITDRLNEAAGPYWGSAWDPVTIGNRPACRFVLNVLGMVRSDIGTPSQTEAEKGMVSDGFKRAFQHYGSNHLYHFPDVWAAYETNSRGKDELTDASLASLDMLTRMIYQGVPTLPRSQNLWIFNYTPIFPHQEVSDG